MNSRNSPARLCPRSEGSVRPAWASGRRQALRSEWPAGVGGLVRTAFHPKLDTSIASDRDPRPGWPHRQLPLWHKIPVHHADLHRYAPRLSANGTFDRPGGRRTGGNFDDPSVTSLPKALHSRNGTNPSETGQQYGSHHHPDDERRVLSCAAGGDRQSHPAIVTVSACSDTRRVSRARLTPCCA